MNTNPNLARDQRINKSIKALDELYNCLRQDVRSKYMPELQVLRDELVGNLSKSRWQAMDTAPAMSNVIVYAKTTNGDWFVGEAFHKVIFGEDEGWWWVNTDSEYNEPIQPSKWQPLPEKPDANS